MRKVILFSILISLHFSLPTFAMEPEEQENINYSIGYFLGKDLAKSSVELEIDQLLDGIYDATEKLDPQYSAEEMKTLLKMTAPEEEFLQKINYAHGYKSGLFITEAEVEFSPEPLLYGVTDVSSKKKPRLSSKEMTELLKNLKKANK